MKWFIPTWNGDLRLLSDPDHPDRTVMTIEKPTVGEQQIVNQIGEQCVKLGYLKQWETLVPRTGWFARKTWRFVIDAPMTSIGPLASSIMRPGPAVLTAIRFVDGECIVTSQAEDELMPAGSPYRVPAALPAAPTPPKPEEPTPQEPKPGGGFLHSLATLVKDTAQAAVTVPRATPCCPSCIPGAIEPATEVLLSFLSPDQHRQWSDHRYVTVDGGLSGHRYLLAHRHTPRARQQGRICMDLDDNIIMHFHDWTLPPEEEVLSAMLVLRHREDWLRNEATCFGGSDVFKNPFGGAGDGVWDSSLTSDIGNRLLRTAPLRPTVLKLSAGWGRRYR